MPDFSILNILISMVIVILVLSLVVQSIQTLIKKVLKLKSRSIMSSLEDLFETITTKSPAVGTPPIAPSKTPQELVADVTNRLKEMGRKSLFGKPMLDSLAKTDLLKILTRVKAEDLLPGTVGNFQAVLEGITKLKDEFGRIETMQLQGEASAKFAALQGSIMPLIHDVEALAEGGSIDPAVFFGDLYRLRQIKAAEVLDILAQVQQLVRKDLAAAQGLSDEARKALAAAQLTKDQEQINAATESDQKATGDLTALKAVNEGLNKIAARISSVSNAFDAAFAPLFARLQQVEVWYDTVMQGFEERYARHMRSVAIIISIFVVVVLNANFFSIYRAIRSDPIKAERMSQQASSILNTARQQNAGQGDGAANPSATPSPSPSPAATTIADVKKENENIDSLVKTYESFGIKPLSGDQIRNTFKGEYSWGDLNETFAGWIIMVMLLSAGAPFWQDTLESLFGLKNLLRQKSDTKNIEEGKGGQPKP